MTCKEIYDLAMDLMDEKKDLTSLDATPESDYKSTKDYQARTPGILSSLANEVIAYMRGQGIDIDFHDRVEKMDDEIELEDYICISVLNYGLAARLLGQEDTEMSSRFSNLYLTNMHAMAIASDDKSKGKQYPGNNIYGLMEAGD